MTSSRLVVTPGVIGGLGPAASLELMHRVLGLTPSHQDQDHIPVLLYSNPRVPSRTKAVFEGGPSPGPELVAMAQRLQSIGADFLVLPCNSAHLYLEEIRSAVQIPVLSMIDLVGRHLQAIPAGSVGLLATTNTLLMGLYDEAVRGRKVLALDADDQDGLMSLIADVKAGKVDTTVRERCLDYAWSLVERGATTTILGCTELSVVAPSDDHLSWLTDPLDLLARAIVEEALGETTTELLESGYRVSGHRWKETAEP